MAKAQSNMSTISIDKAALTEMIREAVKKRLNAIKESKSSPKADHDNRSTHDKVGKVRAQEDSDKESKKEMEDAKKHVKKEGLSALKSTNPLTDPKTFASVGPGKNPLRDPKTFAAHGPGHPAIPLTKPKSPNPARSDSSMRMETMGMAASPAPVSGAPMPPMEEVGIPTQPNPTVADELDLFLRNEYDLWADSSPRKSQIMKNIAKKMKSGQYDSSLAPKLWMWLVDDAAKKYVAKFGDGPTARVDSVFNKATRMMVAQGLAKWFESEVKTGSQSLDKILGTGV